MKSLFRVSLVCALGLVGACSDSTDDPESKPKGIDSDGGTVTEGAASVKVPAGALESPTTIEVAESDVDVDPPAGFALAGPAIAFTPHGLSFEKAVTLTLPYSSDAEQLAVLRLDDERDTSWEVVEGGEFSDGSATLEVRSFSIYAVAEETEAPDGSGGAGGQSAGTSGTGGETTSVGGAGGESAGVGGAGGAAPSPTGDLTFSCDGTDPQSQLRICTDHFFPALIVELAGITAGCQEPAVLGDACDTTDAVAGCHTTNVDDIPGVTVTNWFYQDISNSEFCTEEGSELIDPP